MVNRATQALTKLVEGENIRCGFRRQDSLYLSGDRLCSRGMEKEVVPGGADLGVRRVGDGFTGDVDHQRVIGVEPVEEHAWSRGAGIEGSEPKVQLGRIGVPAEQGQVARRLVKVGVARVSNECGVDPCGEGEGIEGGTVEISQDARSFRRGRALGEGGELARGQHRTRLPGHRHAARANEEKRRTQEREPRW